MVIEPSQIGDFDCDFTKPKLELSGFKSLLWKIWSIWFADLPFGDFPPCGSLPEGTIMYNPSDFCLLIGGRNHPPLVADRF